MKQIKLVAQGSRTWNKWSYPSETSFLQMEMIEECLLIPEILIMVWTGKDSEKFDDLHRTDTMHMFSYMFNWQHTTAHVGPVLLMVGPAQEGCVGYNQGQELSLICKLSRKSRVLVLMGLPAWHSADPLCWAKTCRYCELATTSRDFPWPSAG